MSEATSFHFTPIGQAHYAVKQAVRYGRLPSARTLPCARCGRRGKRAMMGYHHASYAKRDRLKVVALCWRCHVEAHTED